VNQLYISIEGFPRNHTNERAIMVFRPAVMTEVYVRLGSGGFRLLNVCAVAVLMVGTRNIWKNTSGCSKARVIVTRAGI